MISLKDVTLRRGARVLFSQVNITINAGYRIGVIGRNGVGKSSFFALLREELTVDAGTVERVRGIRIASVAQETPTTDRSALDCAIDGDDRLRRVESEIAGIEAANLGHSDGVELAKLHTLYDEYGGYTVRSRAAAMLHGLGFAAAEIERPVNSFSGGWRMRLSLAQALMSPSDLLLLDEPTNHLDLEAIVWLEQWLRTYSGTLIFISHDRQFLENVATHILHFDGYGMALNTGTLSAFERQYAARLAAREALRRRQQDTAARIERFVERFRAKASKARQAQSRLKALEKMQFVAAAHVDSTIGFSFEAPERLPSPLVAIQAAAVGYNAEPILANIDLTIQPGDRLGLIGPNGAGKTTLMRLLAGIQPAQAGEVTRADYLRVGYFAQHQLDQLAAEVEVGDVMRQAAPHLREQEILDYLGAFGFSGERVRLPCGALSGGEKARLILSIIIKQRPNLLLLDEPTNHLDLEMRDALSMALMDFSGAVVLVSHDRHLLDAVSQEFRLVGNGRVRDFEGDLSDYSARLAKSDGVARPVMEPVHRAHSAASRKNERAAAALLRERLRPLSERVRRLERELQRLAAERADLQNQLGDPDLYVRNDSRAVTELLVVQAKLDAVIKQVEEDWLNAVAEYESNLDG